MRLLRSVSGADVREATGRADTDQLLSDRSVRELWEFSREDVARVSVMVHDLTGGDLNGPLDDLFEAYVTWLRQAGAGPEGDARTHRYFLDQLNKQGRLKNRPVLQDESIRVHDGRHRLFATYDAAQLTRRVFPIEVYWVHAWPDGVLARIR